MYFDTASSAVQWHALNLDTVKRICYGFHESERLGNVFFILGGIWLGILYGAVVAPATIHVVRVCVTHGWRAALKPAIN